MSLHVHPTVAFNLAQAVAVQALILEAVVAPAKPTFGWQSKNQALSVLRRKLPGFDDYTSLVGQFIIVSDEAEQALRNYQAGLCKLSEVRHLIKRMASYSNDYAARLSQLRTTVRLFDEALIAVNLRNLGLAELF